MKKYSFLFLLLFAQILCAQQGLTGEYFKGTNFGEKVMTRTDKSINFFWDGTAPARSLDPQSFSVRWTGKIKAPKSGTYTFSAKVDDGIRVWVNGKNVINNWNMNDHAEMSGTVTLTAGMLYDLKVEYFNGLFEGEVSLFWQLPGEEPGQSGIYGVNDRLIEAKYFYKPGTTLATTNPPPPPSAPKPRPTPPPTTPPVAKPKPVPNPTPKPVALAKDSLERYIPKNVMFERGKSILLPESHKGLDELAAFLNRNKTLKVSIEGHTDVVGDAAKNLELSEERAKRVANYLTGKGVDAKRLTTKGYGDTRPLNKETNTQGYAQNRRVEFVVTR